MSTIPPRLRHQVFARANDRCEYCQTAKIIVITMEIDHIIPVAFGGDDTLDNLCLACISCNSYKGAFQTGLDSESGEEVRLFNARRQNWREHFRWSIEGNVLIGLTPTGRATISRLRINRDEATSARLRWVAAGWHPPR